MIVRKFQDAANIKGAIEHLFVSFSLFLRFVPSTYVLLLHCCFLSFSQSLSISIYPSPSHLLISQCFLCFPLLYLLLAVFIISHCFLCSPLYPLFPIASSVSSCFYSRLSIHVTLFISLSISVYTTIFIHLLPLRSSFFRCSVSPFSCISSSTSEHRPGYSFPSTCFFPR